MISLIAAMDLNRAIGVGNTLPWVMPSDMKRFRAMTKGHYVIMGRKTFESMGKPLPNRENIVVTRQTDFNPPGCRIVHSIEDALELARVPDPEPFVIGGAEIYKLALPYAHRIYLTEIDLRVSGGDTFFPQIDPQLWTEIEREEHVADALNPHSYRYITYAKKN